jgi:hypothetical protein
MWRLAVVAAAVAASFALAVPANAWPPVCIPIVYNTTGLCV